MRPALSAFACPLALGIAFAAALPAAVGCSSSGGSPHEQSSNDAGVDSSLGDEDAGPGCTNVTPASCPTLAPTYTADVLPLLQAHCYECHADAGIDLAHSGLDLGSYDAVYAERGDVLSQLSSCRMPPATAPSGVAAPDPVSDTDRATILGWVKCGSLDN